MTKYIVMVAVAICLGTFSLATTHVITVADFSFTPPAISTVHPGDTFCGHGVAAHTQQPALQYPQVQQPGTAQ